MEWTDTLMLDNTIVDTVGRRDSALDFTRVVPLQGMTLLCANTTSQLEAATALDLLREYRATGRRIVLCDTSQLVVGRQFGLEVVERGGANLLVSCGISGREVGIGARDAGLDLASVVVCVKPTLSVQVLAKQLMPGDTVLLLGVDEAGADAIVEQLEAKFLAKTSLVA